jgi:hypothetical protein
MGRPPLNLVSQRFGKWTVLELAGQRGSARFWRCRCDCGTVKVIRREILLHGTRGACDRCANLAKPSYQKVARWRAQNVPQVEMARRLGTSRQRVGKMLDVIEGRQPMRRSKTHCPHGHRYTKQNTRYARHGWRYCRMCATARWQARLKGKRKGK